MSKVRDKVLIATYGDEVLDAGFTSVPNLLLERQVDLGLTDKELLLFIKTGYCNYRSRTKRIKDKDLKMISSSATISRLRTELKKKGYLETKVFYVRGEDGKVTGEGVEYDWSGLIEKLKSLSQNDKEIEPEFQNEGSVESPSNQNDGSATLPSNQNERPVKNDSDNISNLPSCQNDETVQTSQDTVCNEIKPVSPSFQNEMPDEKRFSPSYHFVEAEHQNDRTIKRHNIDNTRSSINNTRDLDNNIVENFEKEKIEDFTDAEYQQFIKSYVGRHKNQIEKNLIPQWERQYPGLEIRKVLNTTYKNIINNPNDRIDNFIQVVENNLDIAFKTQQLKNETGDLFDVNIYCPNCEKKKQKINLVQINGHYHCPECLQDFDEKLNRKRKQKMNIEPETKMLYEFYLEKIPQQEDYIPNWGTDLKILNAIVKRVKQNNNGETIPLIKNRMMNMFKSSFYQGINNFSLAVFSKNFNQFADDTELSVEELEDIKEDDRLRKEFKRNGLDYDAFMRNARKKQEEAQQAGQINY